MEIIKLSHFVNLNHGISMLKYGIFGIVSQNLKFV